MFRKKKNNHNSSKELKLTPEEFRQAGIRGDIYFLITNLADGNHFEAIKRLGSLESKHADDISYYAGMIKHSMKDLDGAVLEYSKVDSNSEHYLEALHNIAHIYGASGNIEGLMNTLKKSELNMLDVKKMEIITNCLMHRLLQGENIDSGVIDSIEMSPIDNKAIQNDPEAFFRICRMYTDLLVIARECINQIVKYQYLANIQASEIEKCADIKTWRDLYASICNVLTLFDCVETIKFPEPFSTLSNCALANASWENKLNIFKSHTYGSMIASIVVQICSPDIHDEVSVSDVMNSILEKIVKISPLSVQQIIDHYFDVIVKLCEQGDPSVMQYIGLARLQILAEGKDMFNLGARIERLRGDLPSDSLGNYKESILLAKNMSREGYEAMQTAEWMFSKIDGDKFSIRDASTIALSYYRIIEMEYNRRLIVPFMEKVNIEKLETTIAQNEELEKKWGSEISIIKYGMRRDIPSLEVGKIRILLKKIRNNRDTISKSFYNILMNLLTEDGKDAFYNEKIIDIIGKSNVDEYRTPGAHIGYMPYSKAREAREFVLKSLPEISTWFIND